jgi:hypothetical protein
MVRAVYRAAGSKVNGSPRPNPNIATDFSFE